MNSITIDTFHDALKTYVDQVITTHEPLRVTWHEGKDFIVVSAEAWERQQERLHVLRNNALTAGEEYRPTEAAVSCYDLMKDGIDCVEENRYSFSDK